MAHKKFMQTPQKFGIIVSKVLMIDVLILVKLPMISTGVIESSLIGCKSGVVNNKASGKRPIFKTELIEDTVWFFSN